MMDLDYEIGYPIGERDPSFSGSAISCSELYVITFEPVKNQQHRLPIKLLLEGRQQPPSQKRRSVINLTRH